MNEKNADGDMWMDSLTQWWREKENPLYAWAAIARCLHAQPRRPLPEWCLGPLAQAARNLTELSHGRDFRSGDPIEPNRAAKLVPEALRLSKQGQKSAFQRVIDDAQDQRAALQEEYDRDGAAIGKLAQTRSIKPERARRRLARGRKMLGMPPANRR